MQLKSVVYVSKHRFKEFTKQTRTLLLIDFDSVTFILWDANWEPFVPWGGYKMVAEGNVSSESQSYRKHLISFCFRERRCSN